MMSSIDLHNIKILFQQIKAKKDGEAAEHNSSDSDSDAADDSKEFNVIEAYRRILELMQPKETIKRTLQRLGGKSAKLSSAERRKMKKAGIVDPNAILVTELTELTNAILTKMGNMDIYEETYEQIHEKYSVKTKLQLGGESSSSTKPDQQAHEELDMYADDFDIKEKSKIITITPNLSDAELMKPPQITSASNESEVMWEFKWKQDDEQVHSGFSSAQMQHWVEEGYFKDGVLVRKVGQDTQFNTSNRIDFELYL